MLIHNVDILTDLDLKALVCQHESREAYATLVVQQAVADRVLKFNHGILKGWGEQANRGAKDRGRRLLRGHGVQLLRDSDS